MTRKSTESILNRVNSTQTARARARGEQHSSGGTPVAAERLFSQLNAAAATEVAAELGFCRSSRVKRHVADATPHDSLDSWDWERWKIEGSRQADEWLGLAARVVIDRLRSRHTGTARRTPWRRCASACAPHDSGLNEHSLLSRPVPSARS